MPESARKAGALYVVATPIGNLSDMTFRAVETLSGVDMIAAEDTRHSRHLMTRYSISTPLLPYHEHNEGDQSLKLVAMMLEGKSVALISDAGTPLISDPGFRLIQAAQESDIRVIPVPGCCAAIAALSVAGLPVDRFTFEGFLPSRRAGRVRKLQSLVHESRTMIFYESAHRIGDSLSDIEEVLGSRRRAVFAREMTKQFETIVNGELAGIREIVAADGHQQKGEIVLLIEGAEVPQRDGIEGVLVPLMKALSLKQAVELTVEITGHARNDVYARALELKQQVF